MRFLLVFFLVYASIGYGWLPRKSVNHRSFDRTLPIWSHSWSLYASPSSEEYTNVVTRIFGQFIAPSNNGKNAKAAAQSGTSDESITFDRNADFIRMINWNAKKRRKTSLSSLAKSLETSLRKSEWFVTGRVEPTYFSDDFLFEDPDVKIKGIKEYALGVNKIFDQATSRAELVCIDVDEAKDMLTVTWRLEGRVNIGPAGIKIKPYIVYTDFAVSPIDGLIVSQLDRFSVPGYDILLSGLFPFLQRFLAPPAPTVADLMADAALNRRVNKKGQ